MTRRRQRKLSATTIGQMPSPSELANYFGVTVDTTRRWARQNRPPAIKLAGRWRFHRAWSDWLDREMYRQMYARESARRPDNGVAHPPKEAVQGRHDDFLELDTYWAQRRRRRESRNR